VVAIEIRFVLRYHRAMLDKKRRQSLVALMALVTSASACSTTTDGAMRNTPKHKAEVQTPPAQQVSPAQGQQAPPAQASPILTSNYEKTLWNIALAIEKLKGRFPQLADFSARQGFYWKQLVIFYAYKTHRARRRGGWGGAVPNPDADGVWFHLDFHDPKSKAQIHTQPVVAKLRYREKRVMFLILEGAKTQPLTGEIQKILRDHGAHPKNQH